MPHERTRPDTDPHDGRASGARHCIWIHCRRRKNISLPWKRGWADAVNGPGLYGIPGPLLSHRYERERTGGRRLARVAPAQAADRAALEADGIRPRSSAGEVA